MPYARAQPALAGLLAAGDFFGVSVASLGLSGDCSVWCSLDLAIGTDMGKAFGRGLLNAASVTGNTLDLRGKMGGDKPTVVRVVGEMSASLKSLSVKANGITSKEAEQLAAAVLASKSLEVLSDVPIKELREDKLTELNNELPTDIHFVRYKKPTWKKKEKVSAIRAYRKVDIFDTLHDQGYQVLEIESGYGTLRPNLFDTK